MSDIHPFNVNGLPAGGAKRHEAQDVDARGICIAAGVLAVTVAVVFVAVRWTFDFLGARHRSKPSEFPLAAEEHGRLPPEPRLEEIDRLEARSAEKQSGQEVTSESHRLDSYGWVDRKSGIVRIPIDRAMKIIAENHLLPARPVEATGPKAEREQPRPSAANSGRVVGREK